MEFGGDISETFDQINAAGLASNENVNVSITDGGDIVGQGITPSARALGISGGNLDAILDSFGGIDVEGGAIEGGASGKLKHKVNSVMRKTRGSADKIDKYLDKELKQLHNNAVDLEEFAELAKSALNDGECSHDVHEVLKKIVKHVDESARAMRHILEKDLKQPKQKTADFLSRNKQFMNAIHSLGATINENNVAGMMSLSFSNVNELKKVAREVSEALKNTDMKKKEYLGKSLSSLDSELTKKLNNEMKKNPSPENLKKFLRGWKTLLDHHGHSRKLDQFIGGADMSNKLADRLLRSREEIKNMVNKFIAAFGSDLDGIVKATNELATHLGKDIPYTDETIQFIDSFTRLNEYLVNNKAKFYQHLLEINADQIDSREIKSRFLNNLRVLAEKASEMGNAPIIKKFVSECESATRSIHSYSDMIKSYREEVKKDGGSTDAMNELYSIDASKIEISALVNPLENLEIAIKKLQLFKNIAIFRSNLAQTNKELAVYSKDYEKSVGKAIGEAISRISNEYSEIINQISDNKSGMGLEIDMYNESLEKGQKISKEKLKEIYKWQNDARIGLYKTIEAVDLYLLHFTDAITKNPDSVSDLHKLLTHIKIIARWYDEKAGNNLIRVFESFRAGVNDEVIDNDAFIADYNADGMFADLTLKLGGDRAYKVYQRCKRAVEGVVVLKNIISYFISLGEKYGDYKSEKSIYMAPSNIYKNLVNYIWVSALDVNTSGTEIINDNNETKRLLTYEDTKVKLAQITDIDPETMGINFNRHSIDKLRILKCHNELIRLRESLGSMVDLDIRRIKQFVAGVFARLGKTKYIFSMFPFGVYDLSMLDNPLLEQFVEYVESIRLTDFNNVGNNAIRRNNVSVITFVLPAGGVGPGAGVRSDDADLVAQLQALTVAQRKNVRIYVDYGAAEIRENSFVSLERFMQMPEDEILREDGLSSLNGLASLVIRNDGTMNETPYIRNPGFFSGFLSGLTSSTHQMASITYAARINGVLQYCIMDMLNKFKREHNSSVFAIDDTYFILTVKAIAGKIMAITGVNSLFKNPNAYRNTIVQNKTRLIMGGSDSILADPEIIDDAVELYVRLPLFIEFYRVIFDNGNKNYKQESTQDMGPLDEEQISFVPEIGNIWSNLIKNIFDKAKHIENGVYTQENMRKIVSEINAIYGHYKKTVSSEELNRYIIMELRNEVCRRFGVIKRQDLLNYYRVLNSTKRNSFDVTEANFSNNDFDILNQEIEFEEKSPSDAYINLKSTLADSKASVETKINKLTDYKILKDFRERIDTILNVEERRLHAGDDVANTFLTMVDRIRMLKKAVSSRNSQNDKYDLIIKAIDESDSMNQSSSDIFACFHEFVVVPLRMASHMHKALEKFMLEIYSVMYRVAGAPVGSPARIASFERFNDNPIMQSMVRFNGAEVTFAEAMRRTVTPREVDELSNGDAGGRVLRFGRGIAAFDNGDDDNRTIIDNIGGDVDAGTVQLLLADIFSHFCHNSGDLAKVTIGTTGRMTIDLSEYQTLCEYLVVNTRFMIDKFTGLVPTQLIENVTKADREGTIFWLEDNLVNKMFNKINKSESERSVLSTDNINKIMPLISDTIFNSAFNASKIITHLALNRDDGRFRSISTANALPVIRDSFMEYDQGSRIFKTGEFPTMVYDTLFNASANTTISEGAHRYGLVQEFNKLVAHYLNDMYDMQTRKMYPKLFLRFANNAFLEALNGQSFADFMVSDVAGAMPDVSFYNVPSSHGILSATLAYVMKTMSTRVHPISGVKIHEVGSLQEVSAHILEKYRSLLPMYIRLFKIFLTRCKYYRKIISKVQVDNLDLNIGTINVNGIPDRVGLTRENSQDVFINFSTTFTSLNGVLGADARDRVLLYIDDIVNGVSSLLEDAQLVHKELREMDDSVPLFFDMKKDFTKTFYLNTQDLPFAPLSTLTIAFNGADNGLAPFPSIRSSANSKFLYGIQSLLIDDFKLSVTKVPFMKKLLSDFNGYNTKINNITESKFNDMLGYLGKAFNFYYDLRFFNGTVFANNNAAPQAIAAVNIGPVNRFALPVTFQEQATRDASLVLIESINPIDSKNKVAEYIKTNVVRGPIAAYDVAGANPRSRVIMVNIIDLNIVPINVHSLMREIPLANLYNYAMTFDSFISELNITPVQAELLRKPYTRITVEVDDANVLQVNLGAANANLAVRALAPPNETVANVAADNSLRFINDILYTKIPKVDRIVDAEEEAANVARANGDDENAARAQAHAVFTANLSDRVNSKLFHNLTFLTLVQYAIKKKVKSELDFINSRVVSNTAAVSDVITNARADIGDVNDNLFEF